MSMPNRNNAQTNANETNSLECSYSPKKKKKTNNFAIHWFNYIYFMHESFALFVIVLLNKMNSSMCKAIFVFMQFFVVVVVVVYFIFCFFTLQKQHAMNVVSLVWLRFLKYIFLANCLSHSAGILQCS